MVDDAVREEDTEWSSKQECIVPSVISDGTCHTLVDETDIGSSQYAGGASGSKERPDMSGAHQAAKPWRDDKAHPHVAGQGQTPVSRDSGTHLLRVQRRNNLLASQARAPLYLLFGGRAYFECEVKLKLSLELSQARDHIMITGHTRSALWMASSTSIACIAALPGNITSLCLKNQV